MDKRALIYVSLAITLLISLAMTILYFDSRDFSKSGGASVADTHNLKSLMFEALYANNRKIDLKTSLISLNRDTVSLGDILCSDSKYLIFRYSGFGCNSCVNETAAKLTQMRDELHCINIIFLPYYETLRDMIVQNTQSFRNRFPLYLVSENDIGLPPDKIHASYLIFVDDGKTSKHTLLVDYSQTDLIDMYLHMISKKYCN